MNAATDDTTRTSYHAVEEAVGMPPHIAGLGQKVGA